MPIRICWIKPFGQSRIQKHYWVDALINPSEISIESESTTIPGEYESKYIWLFLKPLIYVILVVVQFARSLRSILWFKEELENVGICDCYPAMTCLSGDLTYFYRIPRSYAAGIFIGQI